MLSPGAAGGNPLIITIFFTPRPAASASVLSVSWRCFSPSTPGSSGLPETFSAAIFMPRLSSAAISRRRLPASCNSATVSRCGAEDQPPVVISTPNTPSSPRRSSMASNGRWPRLSVQKESFMLLLRINRFIQRPPNGRPGWRNARSFQSSARPRSRRRYPDTPVAPAPADRRGEWRR
ncbi:hypothetical protein D3C72_1586930 [compost metagenome]